MSEQTKVELVWSIDTETSAHSKNLQLIGRSSNSWVQAIQHWGRDTLDRILVTHWKAGMMWLTSALSIFKYLKPRILKIDNDSLPLNAKCEFGPNRFCLEEGLPSVIITYQKLPPCKQEWALVFLAAMLEMIVSDVADAFATQQWVRASY